MSGHASHNSSLSRWRRMPRRSGFTLIEVILALSVLLIVGQVMLRGQRQFLANAQRPIPAVQWYLMLHELENPAHGFTLMHSAERSISLKAANGKVYLLVWAPGSDRRIKLIGPSGGRIFLMNHVKTFSYQYDQHLLQITTDAGETFTARLLLAQVTT